MLVISHRFKKIGLHNLVVRRIFSDILLVLGLKKVEKHCSRIFQRKKYTNIFKEVNTKYMKEFKTKQAKFKGLLRAVGRQGYGVLAPLFNIGIHMKRTTKEWGKSLQK
jgi:hypothetical protein